MYLYTPDEIDRERAHHQAVIQGNDDLDVKRIGNLGELAFEQFCREYLPVEMWEWENEAAIRRCNPESFSGHDFEVFGYKIDVKTSRDVSAFRPANILENDPDDDIIVMVWHRDNEDALILLGWERTETLKSKVKTQDAYSGEEPAKLAHLAARPMNELHDLGPNTAHLNQKPENPFKPGVRVMKSGDDNASVAVVVEVLPPEKNTTAYGQEMDGEAVNVTFPNLLDEGPGIGVKSTLQSSPPTVMTSTSSSTPTSTRILSLQKNPFTPGDYVIKPDYDDPDLAVVLTVAEENGDNRDVNIAFCHHLEEEVDGNTYMPPSDLESFCDESGIKSYSYNYADLSF